MIEYIHRNGTACNHLKGFLNMSFGQILKKLRRNADMTQDQLAELLSISPQAISRWETDAAMPDISFLRPLSNIFAVTVDELLEIDVSRINEAVKAYKQEIKALYNEWKIEEMVELARAACRDIPNNLELVGQLAFALENAAGMENVDEAISLHKKILEKSLDNTLRFRSAAALCRLYATKKGDPEQALVYAKQLPKGHIQTSSYLIMKYALSEDDEKSTRHKRWIEECLAALTEAMYMLADPNYENKENGLTILQRIELLEKLLSIQKIIYGENLLSANRKFYEVNRIIGCLYLLEEQYENALDHFEKAADYAIADDRYADGETYTSLVMDGVECDPHSLWNITATEDLLNRFTEQQRYDRIREDERFGRIIKKLSDNPV